jgi:UPF0716 protein FxsA
MVARLFLLFTVVPIVELYFLIKLGELLGALNTVLLLMAAALAGALLVRWEGLRTLKSIAADLGRGRLPAERLLDGFFILVAGVLLITPGVVTDLLALLLLIPLTRAWLKRWLKKRMERMVRERRLQFYVPRGREDG